MVHQKANPQLKLFSLSSNPEIAEKIAENTGLPLGKVSSRQFSDGEIMMKSLFVGTISISSNLLATLLTTTFGNCSS
mgnify:CR=1 FL=1